MTTTKKINKTELIDILSEKLGESKAQAERILNTFVETITEQLVSGCDVNITGFGAFKPVTRNARDGINPKTKGKMKIPASKSVKFKAGKLLKDAVK